jgi:hypothetical protein
MNRATQIRREMQPMLLLAVSVVVLLLIGPRIASINNGDRQPLDRRASFSLLIHSPGAGTRFGDFYEGSPEVALAMADFTGDTHPDLAILQLHQVGSSSAQYSIEIQLTEGTQQILTLTAPFGGLEVTPKDVTGDGNLDLVIHSSPSHKLIAVFLNDGAGHFHRADNALFPAARSDDSSSGQLTKHATFIAAALGCPKSHGVDSPSNSPQPFFGTNSSLLPTDFWSISPQSLRAASNRAPPFLI